MSRQRPESRLSRGPLVALAVLWLAVGFGWSQLFPPYTSPDEVAHHDLVHRVAEERYFPRDVFYVVEEVRAVANWASSHRVEGRYTTDAPGRADRPSLAHPPPLEGLRGLNQMYQHPPANYVAAAVVDGAADVVLGERGFDARLGAIRLAMAVLGLPIPFFVVATIARLGGSQAAQVLGALLPLAVPQFTASLGTVNNDILLVTCTSAALWVVAGAAAGRARRVDAALLGFFVGAAMLSKGFGLTNLVLVGAFAACTDRPVRERLRLGAIALGVAGAVGGWWWIWNQVRFGTLQPHGAPLELLGLRERPLDAWEWTSAFVPWIISRSWGWFGSFPAEIRLSQLLVAAASCTAAALVAVGVLRGSLAVRRFAATTGVLVAGLLATTAYGAYDLYSTYDALQGIQGRYLFSALPGVAVLAAIGASHVLGSLRAAVPAGLAAVGVMQAAGAVAMLDGFWGPDGASLRSQIAALRYWSPWHPVVLLAAVLAGIGAVVTLVAGPRAKESS